MLLYHLLSSLYYGFRVLSLCSTLVYEQGFLSLRDLFTFVVTLLIGLAIVVPFSVLLLIHSNHRLQPLPYALSSGIWDFVIWRWRFLLDSTYYASL